MSTTLSSTTTSSSSSSTTTTRPSRIAFGSCNNQDLQNNLWSIIESRQPAAFVFGGDAIYADIEGPYQWDTFPPKSKLICATPSRLYQLYQHQLHGIEYDHFIRYNNITIFGTLDDHDYGCDNADRTYPYRYESGLAFMDFIHQSNQYHIVDQQSQQKQQQQEQQEQQKEKNKKPLITKTTRFNAMQQRAKDGKGVYGVMLLDFARPFPYQLVDEYEAGIDPDVMENVLGKTFTTTTTTTSETPQNFVPNYSNQSVAVFVLDVRTHKTPWKKGSLSFQPDYEGDFLGTEQWIWFEQALQQSRASVNIIVNGLQVHANRFPDANVAESWNKFPTAQQRLYNAIFQSGIQTPILISGDVHMTQLMQKDCIPMSTETMFVQTSSSSEKKKLQHQHESNNDDHHHSIASSRPLLELTTSGMTHSWGTLSNHPNSITKEKYYPTWQQRMKAWLERILMHTLHMTCPWTDIVVREQQKQQQQHGLSNQSMKKTTTKNTGGWFPAISLSSSMPSLQYALEKNFGEIEFNWDDRTIVLRSIGEDHTELIHSMEWSMDELSGYTTTTLHTPTTTSRSMVSTNDYMTAIQSISLAQSKIHHHYEIQQQEQHQQTHENDEQPHGATNNSRSSSTNMDHSVWGSTPSQQWVCVNHRGRDTPIQHMTGHVIGVLTLIVVLSPIPTAFLSLCYLIRRAMQRHLSNQKFSSSITPLK